VEQAIIYKYAFCAAGYAGEKGTFIQFEIGNIVFR
jgi:hypothetical protein